LIENFMESAQAIEVKEKESVSEGPPAIATSPERFINRELSWLHFNRRVLEESVNAGHPALERVRFLSISANNLDEFFMVRVAGIKAQVREGIRSQPRRADSPPSSSSSSTSRSRNSPTSRRSGATSHRAVEGRHRTRRRPRRHQAERTWIEDHFLHSIFPLLTPLAIDPAPFPFIPNLAHRGPAIVPDLRRQGDERADPHARQDRPLHPYPRDGRLRLITLEQATGLHRPPVPGYTVKGQGAFLDHPRPELEIEEEAEDLVRVFETALKRRRRGSVIRLEIEAKMPEERASSQQALNAADDEVFPVDGVLAMNELSQLTRIRPDLEFTLCAASSRTVRVPWRRYLRRDPAEGPDRPSPL
jgi:polyphosphate kinase